MQELQPQQQQQQAAHQLKLQQAALVTAAAAAASAATPGGTAPLPAVIPPPPSGVVVVAPAPPANPKWVDRPRTSLHARAYLRLGMWQWSMNEVRDRWGGDILGWRVWGGVDGPYLQPRARARDQSASPCGRASPPFLGQTPKPL